MRRRSPFQQASCEFGPYDVILDVIGGDYLERNVCSLAADGRLVAIGLQNGLEGQLNLAEIVFKRISVYGTTLRTRSKEISAGRSLRSGGLVSRPLRITDSWLRL